MAFWAFENREKCAFFNLGDQWGGMLRRLQGDECYENCFQGKL